MNKNLLIGVGVFIAVIVVGLFFIGKPKNKNTSLSQQTPSPSTTSIEESSVNEDGVREITISGNEYSFNPSSFTVSKGEKIRLTFTNVGSNPHDLRIDELGVKTKTVGRGKSDVVEFVAEKDGTFTFYCSIANHRDLGMEGELKVE